MSIFEGYKHFGGAHPLTATLANALAAQGVVAPHTGGPFSEAMLLGIGGGLGAGYILWEFKAHEMAIIVMGFRNRWNYAVDYLTQITERLGFPLTVTETAGAKKAEQALQAVLDRRTPALMWVDKAQMPYLHLPAALSGYGSHVVGVCGYDPEDEAIWVDDDAAQPFRVPLAILPSVRGRIPSDKNRLATVEPPQAGIDLPGAIAAGLSDCVTHLGRDSESFALPVLRKWARLMTDTRNPKGWPVVFRTRLGLYSTLRSVFEEITLDGTEGSGLRGLYAAFLEEAAPVLGRDSLRAAAGLYRRAADAWIALAEAALPEDIPALSETRRLMRERYAALRAGQMETLAAVSARLEAMQAAHDRAFPADDARIDALFADFQARLTAVYECEVAALEALRAGAG